MAIKHAPEQELERPKVGIGVMIIKDGKVLLGKRKGSHGAGEYAFPGGHLQYMESFENCAKRETREETGMEIRNVRFLHLLNLKEYPPKHYVHMGLIADWEHGEPRTMESDRMGTWNWYDIDKLPKPLFKTIPSCIEAYKTGKNYWDA